MPFVFERILDSLKRYAKNTAIIEQEKAYTYEELNNYSDKIANYLAKFEVQKDSNVVFLMKRSYHQLATILAIWKLGATYIPLDPKTPKQRIHRIVDNLSASCLVCDPPFLHKVSDLPIRVLTVTDPAFVGVEPQRESQLVQGNLAYIIFTSGSTGEPKGVMINHENLSNHITWLIQDFAFDENDRFSFNSSMAFDFSVATTILPLSVGAALVITTEVDALDLAAYSQQLTQHRISFAKWTPSYFKVLTDYLREHPTDLSSFRFIMVAGEALLTNYAEEWFKLYPNHALINEYGPTETSVGITTHLFTKNTLDQKLLTVPIGKPAINSKFYVVDCDDNLLEDNNNVGELLIGGTSVGVGYYNQPELTAERFIKNPFETSPPRLYRTGDLVQKLSDGTYVYLGRIDHQVKVNGYRIELNEIEHHLLKHPGIKQAKLTLEKDAIGNPRIIAYVVAHDNSTSEIQLLKEWLSEKLPSFMIPQRFFYVSQIPTNNNGKVDFSHLKKITETSDSITLESDETTQGKIRKLIERYTGIANPDQKTPFLYLGLNSLIFSQFVQDINQCLHCKLTIPDLFTYTTIALLSDYIDERNNKISNEPSLQPIKNQRQQTPIAIIAMDCKLPGANNCEELWEICQRGLETIDHFPPKENPEQENLVYARGTLADLEYFDATFFGFNPNDAHLTDPQFRLLLESSWKSLEKAGYSTEQTHYKTGIFVSTNDSTYLLNPNYQNYLNSFQGDRFAVQRLISPQCLATKIAYSLNCTGPSFTLQTACSGSLVSVVLACQQLSEFQCDIAVAGGVSITTPQHQPYTHQEGNIFSPTGHCRPFAARADGTVFSNGLGTVVLKRLEDAIRDNDTIISVIQGASTNNDGAEKMSFTAPSVKGQMECILAAQTSAKLEASSIQYVEAHGTGTFLGDPIEIAALTGAFRRTAKQNQFCAIGSLKANIGHTHVAAGVAGLIKTSLALQHKRIPPSIHCDSLNPNIDWENSPFYVNKNLQYWPQTKTPRRAAVSAFGVGGSNAHVILQEAPPVNESVSAKKPFMLLLSAKTPRALDTMQKNLVAFFKNSQDKSETLLANTAYTLQVGRKKFPYTTGIVCETMEEAITKLQENYGQCILSRDRTNLKPLTFLPKNGLEKKESTLNFEEITFVLNPPALDGSEEDTSTAIEPQTLNAVQCFPSQEGSDPSFSYLICTALTKLWCHGVNIHWAHYYGNHPLKRIALPTYPFERKRFWFDEVVKTPQNSNANEPTVNLYAPVWSREDTALEDIEIPPPDEKFIWIIFANDTKLCSHTLTTLQKQNNPIWVIRTNEKYQIIDRQIHINPKDETHYERMVQTIVKPEHKKCVVLHFWAMNQREYSDAILQSVELYQTLFSGLYLTKALYNRDKTLQMACLMISNQLQNVLGNETIIPSISSILSLCRVISLENAPFRFSSIDIDFNLPSSLIPSYSNHLLSSVVSELKGEQLQEPCIAAFRLGYRWKTIYQTLGSNEASKEPLFKTDGTYLITGGLGAMGLTIASWIADQVPAQIILLSRTSLPLKEAWDEWLSHHEDNDPISQIIQKLNLIEKKGADFKIISADVANLISMKKVINDLQKERPISGVFHLAGIAGEGLSVLKETHTIQSVLSPKLQGTYVLTKLLKTSPLDFFVCASSLTALAGGIGQLDYCAANLFLDYFFSAHRLTKCNRILTLNWNSWSSIGMAAHLGTSKTHEKLYLENSVSPKEAMQYLEHAMRLKRKQIVISKNDPLTERKRIITAFRNSSPTFHLINQQNQLTQLETIWKNSLGIPEILPEDTFYSLGGDSLLAIQLLDKLEKSLKINLSLQEFTHVTTFSSLYEMIKCKPLKSTSPIITLLANESQRNKLSIYFIHPLGGSIFNFLALAPHLTYPANYYAIQDPELSSNKPLFHSLSDMANCYANEIAQHKPHTPIVLIGASLGGNIAMEMVSYLRLHNIDVNKIILIDSWACLNKIVQNAENLSLNSVTTIKKYYGEHSREYSRIKARLSWLRTYKPSYVNASVYLLAAETLLPPYSLLKEEAHGWKIFCRRHIVQDSIPGNHDTMFNPNHLPQLGSKISSILENIEEHEEVAEQSTNS